MSYDFSTVLTHFHTTRPYGRNRRVIKAHAFSHFSRQVFKHEYVFPHPPIPPAAHNFYQLATQIGFTSWSGCQAGARV